MKLLMLLFTLTCTLALTAQEEYKLTKCNVQISGTSTLHDWVADVTKSVGYASLTIDNDVLTEINQLSITMNAASIKSEKGAGMDKNIYKALKTDKYPAITFTLTRVTTVSGITVNAEGKLTIAGTTQPINLSVTGKNNAGTWTFSGTKSLKMTDYNVEPPVVLLGTLKTGNEITITFEATFAASASLTHN